MLALIYRITQQKLDDAIEQINCQLYTTHLYTGFNVILKLQKKLRKGKEKDSCLTSKAQRPLSAPSSGEQMINEGAAMPGKERRIFGRSSSVNIGSVCSMSCHKRNSLHGTVILRYTALCVSYVRCWDACTELVFSRDTAAPQRARHMKTRRALWV